MAVIPGILASSKTGHLITSNFFFIASVTASGGETSLSFTSIPSTYKHLQVRVIYRDTASAVGAATATVNFNNDSGANYAFHQVRGNGSTVNAFSYTSRNNMSMQDFGILAGSGTNIFGAGIMDIVDYASTSKYKTAKMFGGQNANSSSTSYEMSISSGVWMSTSAITSMTFGAGYTAFAAGSTFSLYGVN